MRNRSLFGPWCAAGCALLVVAVGLVGLPSASSWGPAVAAAQDAKEDPAKPAADAPADEAPAAQPISRANADPDAQPTVKQQNVLVWMLKSLGVFYSVAFLALSFTLVAFLVMSILTVRRESIMPAGLIVAFDAHLNARDYQAAYDVAKNDESFLGQTLAAGLAKLSLGYPQAVEAMQETGEDENMKIEHRLSYIALIGTISPMVGLLGTVDGMVASFQVIATSEIAPKPAQLAEGIATALWTTLVGLVIAIPAIAAYGVLRNRAARLVLEVGILSGDLMSRFSSANKKE